jgi:ribose-phosphate pyrophosphokinase
MSYGLIKPESAELKIIAGSSVPELGTLIAKNIGMDVAKVELKRFSDGEVNLEIRENVRGCDVFVIQSTCPPANDNYVELFVILDALKRASAARITAVMPYYGYARQDRKVQHSYHWREDMCFE